MLSTFPTARLLNFAILLATAAFPASSWSQGAPIKNSIVGISIGDTPKAAEARLSELYPGCEIDSREYLKHDPYGTPPGSSEVGDYVGSDDDDCTKSQKQSGKRDYVQVKYVHVSQEPQSPVYQVELNHTYDEPSRLGSNAITVDDLLETLTREYGKPLSTTRKVDEDVLRIRRVIRSKSPGGTPYVTEVKWYQALPKKYGTCMGDECGPLTLDAKIDSEGSPGSNAKQLRVKRVQLTLTDHVLYYKHLEWKVQFDEAKKKGLKSF